MWNKKEKKKEVALPGSLLSSHWRYILVFWNTQTQNYVTNENKFDTLIWLSAWSLMFKGYILTPPRALLWHFKLISPIHRVISPFSQSNPFVHMSPHFCPYVASSTPRTEKLPSPEKGKKKRGDIWWFTRSSFSLLAMDGCHPLSLCGFLTKQKYKLLFNQVFCILLFLLISS